jgi:hypothetical protein
MLRASAAYATLISATGNVARPPNTPARTTVRISATPSAARAPRKTR